MGSAVARGDAAIGFQQMSELLEVAGVDVVCPLPPDVQRVTVIAAGVASNAANPEGARALVRFLASPEAAPTIRRLGLEPIERR